MHEPRDDPKDVVCVIDVLDECHKEDGHFMVDGIKRLIAKNSTFKLELGHRRVNKIRFMVTARANHDTVD